MFSKTLKNLRESAQEKQKDVAKAIFVSPSAISQYEHGRTTPSRSTLEALAKHFNVTTDYLLGSSPNPKLEEAMNQIYCNDISVSMLLDKCMHVSTEDRHHLLAVIDAFQTSPSKANSKDKAK